MMRKLDNLYLRKLTALQIISRRNLEMLKLEDKDNPNKFLIDFEVCLNELKAAGVAVSSEEEKVNYLIRAYILCTYR